MPYALPSRKQPGHYLSGYRTDVGLASDYLAMITSCGVVFLHLRNAQRENRARHLDGHRSWLSRHDRPTFLAPRQRAPRLGPLIADPYASPVR